MISIMQEENMAKHSFFPLQVWKGVLLSVTVLKSRLYRERTLQSHFPLSVSPFLPLLSAGAVRRTPNIYLGFRQS